MTKEIRDRIKRVRALSEKVRSLMIEQKIPIDEGCEALMFLAGQAIANNSTNREMFDDFLKFCVDMLEGHAMGTAESFTKEEEFSSPSTKNQIN